MFNRQFVSLRFIHLQTELETLRSLGKDDFQRQLNDRDDKQRELEDKYEVLEKEYKVLANDYGTLMDIKIRLDAEISAYMKLLEGEQEGTFSRLQQCVDNNVQS